MQSYLEAVLLGIVASLVTVGVLSAAARIRGRLLYGWVTGEYAHFSIEGTALPDDRTSIAYVGGRTMRVQSTGPWGTWSGTLLMSDQVPNLGSGTYQHSDKRDCGRHEVQLDKANQTIFVYGMNTSHGKDYKFSYLLRRRDVQNRAAPSAA